MDSETCTIQEATQICWGLDVELMDVDAERTVSAQELIEKFLDFVRPVIEEFGEWDEVYAIAPKFSLPFSLLARLSHFMRRCDRLR